MRALIVDPSCFTLPYDHCLCEALVRADCQVTLAGARPIGLDWQHRTSYKVWNQFYTYSHRAGVTGKRGILAMTVKGIEHIGSMWRFTAMCIETRPDVIHFQWLPLPCVDSFYLRRLRRTAPLVLTLHNTSLFHGSPTSRLQALGFAAALRLFDRVIVHTEFSRERLAQRRCVPERRVNIIPHGVFDYYRALATRGQGGSVPDTGENVILFFGSIKPYKGLEDLIRAFAMLPQQILDNSKLVVAGKPGMNVRPLIDLAERLGVQQRVVWKLGVIPEEEVPVLFESATVVALPYREIDQSGVLMAALAFDRPIIATRIGGIPEILQDGVHGYLTEPGDFNALGDALRRLLSSPDRQRSMGQAVGCLARDDISWRNVAEKTMALYHELVSGRCPRLERETSFL